MRAEATQINDWEKVGNPGWNWESLFQYYLKSETIAELDARQVAAGLTFAPAFHGTDGPVNTGWPVNIAGREYLDFLSATYPRLGIQVNADPNDGDMSGLSTYPRTQRNINGVDVQESSRTAYYEPVMADRPNMDVITEATARRIVWQSNGSNSSGGVRAAGVEISGSSTRVIKATSEVILAGGSYRTPSILEYSGVGNPSILTPLGINVTVDLPGVGEHLMDQTNNALEFFNSPNITFGQNSTASVAYITAQDIWGSDGAATLAEETLAALPSYAASIASHNNNATSVDDLLSMLRIQYDSMFSANMTLVEILHGLTLRTDRLECEFWSTAPFSRGNVHITNGDPPKGTDRPDLKINNNYFMLDYDLKSQIGAAKTVRRLFSTAPLNGSAVVGEIAPGLNTVPLDASDNEWEVWLKSGFRSAWHPVGSAAMLPRDKGGVVDANLKVYGTANVRVVDASVFPFQVNGHPAATVYAVAEKAADIIKTTYYRETN